MRLHVQQSASGTPQPTVQWEVSPNGGATWTPVPGATSETLTIEHAATSESGYVYQYQFQDAHPAQQGSAKGNEYVYYVSADRKKMFPVRIFVGQDAIKKWGEATGRALTGTEEYAAAKMRLFQAFDEGQELSATGPALVVDESNLNALLQRLDL